MAKIAVTSAGCWEWQGATCRGYGRMCIGSRSDGSRRTALVSRLVLAIRLGRELHADEEAAHDCPGGDNARCVNPQHLYPATHQQNIDDRGRKGRTARGERAGLVKLSDTAVADIRRSRDAGVPLKTLAIRHNVSISLICRVARGRTWRHV